MMLCTAQNAVTSQFAGTKEALMARQSRSKRTKVRGNLPKAQFPAGLATIVSETVRLWRKHHLGYDQTKYIVEQARRRLKLQPVGTRRHTVNRLDKSEVERLIRHTYQSHSKYGLMIKTLFLSGEGLLEDTTCLVLTAHGLRLWSFNQLASLVALSSLHLVQPSNGYGYLLYRFQTNPRVADGPLADWFRR
jgi:hypothetical protein